MRNFDPFIFLVVGIFVSMGIGILYTSVQGFILFGVLLILLSVLPDDDEPDGV